MAMLGRRDWWLILGVAAAMRVAVTLLCWNVLAVDEVFQFLEPGHRLIYGQGIVPWEFLVGLRCWLMPLLLAVPMALGRAISENPLVGLGLARLLMVAASLPIVWVAGKWGERFYGRFGGLVAGLFAACWPDMWVMAPHTMEEVAAADFLVPAIYLVEAARGAAGIKYVGLAGFLLGMAVVVRLQAAPAVAVAGAWLCGRDASRWRAGLAGGILPGLLAGGLDWASWGEPFRSFWLNVYLNLFKGVAAQSFGRSPAGFYVLTLAVDWLWTMPAMLVLGWLGAKKLPVAGVAAVVIVLTHSLIAHKEFRFVFPAVALLVPLAGVGLAGWLKDGLPRGAMWRRAGLAAVALAGPVFSPWLYFLLGFQYTSVQAFDDLRHELAGRPAALVAIGRWNDSFVPIDTLLTGNTRLTTMAVFQTATRPDFIVATEGELSPPAGYAEDKCYKGYWLPGGKKMPRFCVWRDSSPPVEGPAPVWNFDFPAVAKPFRVQDRF